MVTLNELVKGFIDSKEGWAVADQFESSFETGSFEGLNYNALNRIRTHINSLLQSDLLSENNEDELRTYYVNLNQFLGF